MTENEQKLINRMYNTDDYIVQGTGGHFWANQSHRGCLIEGCTHEEVQVVQKLAREGRGGIIHEFKNSRL